MIGLNGSVNVDAKIEPTPIAVRRVDGKVSRHDKSKARTVAEQQAKFARLDAKPPSHERKSVIEWRDAADELCRFSGGHVIGQP